MTTRKVRPRKQRPRATQSHTVTGQASHLTRAATQVDGYPKWPDLVDKPEIPKDRKRALTWFSNYIRHRVPEAWQPADPGRLAQLAVAVVNVGRAMGKGDHAAARVWQGIAAQLSRQLGLNAAAIDPRLTANAAGARAEQAEKLAELNDPLGLLAMPAHPHQLKN